MRIMFVIPRMCFGGAERQVALISNCLVSRGHQIAILSLYNADSCYRLSEKVKYINGPIKCNRFPQCSPIGGCIKLLRKLKNEIESFNPEIVVPLFLLPIIFTYLLNPSRHGYCVVCSERSYPERYSFVKRILLSYLFSKSDALICQSKAVFDYYVKVPKDRKHIIGNAVEFSIADVHDKKNEIIAVGRLEAVKCFDRLIKAYSLVADKLSMYTVHIYGNGSQKDNLNKMIYEMQLEESIIIHDACQEIREKYKEAKVCVITSDYEGFPNVMIEAMSEGLPIITTDFKPGNASSILGEGGIVVPREDIHALSEAILRVATDENLRIGMGEKNLKKIKEFSVDSITELWEKVFACILGEKSNTYK